MVNRLFLMPLIAFAASAATGQPPYLRVSRVPNGGIQPQLAVEPNGTLDVLYFAGDPKNGDLFLVRSSDHGQTFSSPLRVNSQSGSVIALGTIRGGQMAIGAGGRLHVTWNGSGIALPSGPLNPEAGKPGSPMLYTRLNDRGTGFEPQRNLMLRTFGLDGGGTIAADAAGNVFVAWHGKRAGAGQGSTHHGFDVIRMGSECDHVI